MTQGQRRRTARAARPLVGALLGTLALVGCGADVGPGGGGPDDTRDQVDGADGTAGTPGAIPLPGASGSWTVTAPDGWSPSERDGRLTLRADDGFGDRGFRSNVVVTTRTVGAGTLADQGAATTAYAETLPGWDVDEAGTGPTELAGLPAYSVSGTYTSPSAAPGAATRAVVVDQVVVVVELDAQGGAFALLTASAADGDQDGALEAFSVLESLAGAPEATEAG
ncbi:hypothetical protein [Oerskovia flava]|uniref:hypothetical protein n=1 Tax=Oerskovia flava TaxID=2986422 RepID=UPI002240351C|nr:hypothetical protein [Oerskovia sp. JB1-3-2]